MSSILLMCALPEEKSALVEQINRNSEEIVISENFNLKALKYSINGHHVYIKETGMGNTNACIGLTLFLEKYEIDQILLIGVGGALSEKLEIGDIVISDSVLQHDYYSSLDSGNFRMLPGDLILSEADAENYHPIIKSTSLIKQLDIEEGLNVFKGTILSGNEFVGTTKRKKELASLSKDGLLVDMEASAIAFTANKAGIPFLIAKTVSDRLLPDGSIENDFSLFLKSASENAAKITINMLKVLEDAK